MECGCHEVFDVGTGRAAEWQVSKSFEPTMAGVGLAWWPLLSFSGKGVSRSSCSSQTCILDALGKRGKYSQET